MNKDANFVSGRETPHINFKIGSPSSTGVPIFRWEIFCLHNHVCFFLNAKGSRALLHSKCPRSFAKFSCMLNLIDLQYSRILRSSTAGNAENSLTAIYAIKIEINGLLRECNGLTTGKPHSEVVQVILPQHTLHEERAVTSTFARNSARKQPLWSLSTMGGRMVYNHSSTNIKTLCFWLTQSIQNYTLQGKPSLVACHELSTLSHLSLYRSLSDMVLRHRYLALLATITPWTICIGSCSLKLLLSIDSLLNMTCMGEILC